MPGRPIPGNSSTRRSDPRHDMIACNSFSRLLPVITLFTIALTSSVIAQPHDFDAHDEPVAPTNSNNFKFQQEYETVRTVRSPKNSEELAEPVRNAAKQGLSAESNSSAIVHFLDAIDKKESQWAEGGPIPVSFSTSREKMKVESAAAIESDKPDESRTRENVRNANPSVVARKGVHEERVELRRGSQARKGVVEGTLNNVTSEYTKSTKASSVTEAARVNNQTEISNIGISKSDANNSSSNDNLHRNVNSSASLTPTNVHTTKTIVIHNITTTTPKTSSHVPKPKPTVTTVDGPEVNESRPSSRTKSSSFGMPRKIDYIAPVIITIIALPILGAATFMLYRRGRDCWDKRHYRRMDFLIDGMYND